MIPHLPLNILIATLFVVTVLGAGGLLTELGPWYRDLRKPNWQPPGWLFGPVWTLIIACVAWAAILAWEAAPDASARLRIILLLAVNAPLQVLWSPLFFKWRRPDWALYEVCLLWLSIVGLAIGFSVLSVKAGWLLAPYLGWVTFAAYLNLTIVRLNGPFGKAAVGGSA